MLGRLDPMLVNEAPLDRFADQVSRTDFIQAAFPFLAMWINPFVNLRGCPTNFRQRNHDITDDAPDIHNVGDPLWTDREQPSPPGMLDLVIVKAHPIQFGEHLEPNRDKLS